MQGSFVRIDQRRDGVISHWEDARFDAESVSNRVGGLRESLPVGEHGGAMDVRGEVAVPEIEPIGAAIDGKAS